MSLRKGLQRLEGVADAKLILKPPHMAVRMKPGYWPDVARMQETIKDAGYTPIPENVDLIFGGADGTVVYPPRGDIGRIDFLTPDGKGGTWVSHAIYRFEKDGTILFAQNDADKPRPPSFDRAHCDSLFVVRPSLQR